MRIIFLIFLLVVTICTTADGFQTGASDEAYYSFVVRLWACGIGWMVMVHSLF
jgi:hypothetical protein